MSKPNEQEKTIENKTAEETPKPPEKPNESAKSPAEEKIPEKTYTKAEQDAAIEAAVKKALKDVEKKAAEAEAKAKLSEDERTKAELDDVRRENQMLKAESQVVKALKDAGANDPNLLFAAKKSDLEFKDGKLVNLDEILADCKTSFPTQFGTEKPKETINGGAGNSTPPKGRAESLGEALKNFYKK